MRTKTIQFTQKDFKLLKSLIKDFDELFGDEDTIWTLDDLDGLRQIGQEFIDVFKLYLK